MAKAKVVHSQDACTVIFKGDKKKPEPTIGIIKFPGGMVEVSRTTDGKYWAHISVDKPCNTRNSRIDYDYEGNTKAEIKIPDVPHAEHIQHIAVLIDGPYRAAETL